MPQSYVHLYRRFRQAHQDQQFYTAHSHHFWPDVTRDAMLQYWDDSASWVDDKWQHFFAVVIPDLQQLIAQRLNLSSPEQLVFAPNTHELLYRVLSSFASDQPLNVLSTDGEFHSFRRQIDRYAEQPQVTLRRLPVEPFDTLSERLKTALIQTRCDLLFISQVFFGCGRVLPDLQQLVQLAASRGAQVIVDGYHGFCALPTDLSAIQQHCFYLGGGYKYAQGGEGSCFMHVPPNCQLRPLNTGWYAEFGQLADADQGVVGYADNGMRFAGATMDLSPLYRLRAVLALFAQLGLDDAQLHGLIVTRRQAFLEQLAQWPDAVIGRHNLIAGDEPHGHFLAFELARPALVQSLLCYLRQHGIYADGRGRRIRFGFGLHLDSEEMDLSSLQKFKAKEC